MVKGYTKLMGTRADVLHYIYDGHYYYSLSFKNSQKIKDIRKGIKIHAIAELENQNDIINVTGPLKFDSMVLSNEKKEVLINKHNAREVEIEIIEDFSLILEIQELFKKLDFNYFPDAFIKEDKIVILKYKFK